ncbi:hypothetical protein ACTXT7_013543 [Hymenolepis weldensis]
MEYDKNLTNNCMTTNDRPSMITAYVRSSTQIGYENVIGLKRKIITRGHQTMLKASPRESVVNRHSSRAKKPEILVCKLLIWKK